MPQASEKLRRLMNKYFGDPVNDTGPMDFLTKEGFTLTRKWKWYKRGIINLNQLTDKEYYCMIFLVQEWDFDPEILELNNNELFRIANRT